MVPARLTRRDALRLSSAALAGLAGCTTRDSDEPDLSSPTATERQYSQRVTGPESRKVRNPDGEPAVRSSAHSPERDHPFSGDLEPAPGWGHEYWFVTSPSERNALEFSEATIGVEAASDFVADTDLSEATLLVQQYMSGECTTVQLHGFEWEEAERGPDGSYDVRAEYRDSQTDGNCDSETEKPAENEVHAILSRLPVDVAEVRSFEYGW